MLICLNPRFQHIFGEEIATFLQSAEVATYLAMGVYEALDLGWAYLVRVRSKVALALALNPNVKTENMQDIKEVAQQIPLAEQMKIAQDPALHA